MVGLKDWIIEPKFVKRYSHRSLVAFEMRSVLRHGLQRQSVFNTFALKI